MKSDQILINFLKSPKLIAQFSEEEIGHLIRQSYATGLTARVYSQLSENGLMSFIPDNMRWHFSSANKLFKAHKHDINNEIKRITNALKFANISPVFLKGAAYIIADNKCHQGRLFSDVDIFVDKSDLSIAEGMLRLNGWINNDIDEHDEKYYRDWMHEIPPLINTKSDITIDVHHNLVPLVSRIKLNSDLLLDRVVNSSSGIKTLSPMDKILHSSAHLLLDGEFDHGFRDIHDLYLLLTEYMLDNPDFIDDLIGRAEELGFELILYYCLLLQVEIFKLNIPISKIAKLKQKIPTTIITDIVFRMFLRVLCPEPSKLSSFRYKTSLFLLYIRSHWLKMPMHLLIPHLLYKAIVTPFKERKKIKELENNPN